MKGRRVGGRELTPRSRRTPPPPKKRLKELQKSISLVLTYVWGGEYKTLLVLVLERRKSISLSAVYTKSGKKPLQYSNLSPFSGYHPHTARLKKNKKTLYSNAIASPVRAENPTDTIPIQFRIHQPARYIHIFGVYYVSISFCCPTPPSAPTLLLSHLLNL